MQSGYLLGGRIVELGGLLTSGLELALGNAEFLGDDGQIAPQVCVGVLILRDAIFQRRHVLLNGLLCGLQLGSECLLVAIELGRGIPAESKTPESDQAYNNDGRKLPRSPTPTFHSVLPSHVSPFLLTLS